MVFHIISYTIAVLSKFHLLPKTTSEGVSIPNQNLVEKRYIQKSRKAKSYTKDYHILPAYNWCGVV